ncbi:RNA polymerase sigma factor [Oleiharenicola lentus]|uniref:RNA polymerase sigma factor n=1 Tax=Oleiharenicola lentus TaxID=2508720 RepID=UPI003F68158C
MKFTSSTPLISAASDAELVAACLAGEREAFARIVERYQRLLCSLAYSSTGNVTESEDAAQEAFIAAWTQLPDLREPEKLRPWLCGILRHKLSRLRRQYGRDAALGAEPVEAAADIVSEDVPAVEKTMRDEEQVILWRALERVPPLYREALVLYYRENSSIEHVACALDVSEDAVKQRLARGRKLLQEQALAFVEGALARTTPGRAFTLGVLAALPALATPTTAKAAGLGAAVAANSGLAAKTTALAAVMASASGVASTAMQLRVGLDQSRTHREKRLLVITTIVVFFGSLAFLGAIWGLRVAALRSWEQRVVFATIAQVAILAFVIAWPFALVRLLRFFRRLRSEERRLNPESFRAERDQIGSAAGIYRSRATLFGVPLVHIRFASPDESEGPVVGWIAGGDRAYGLLVAWGAVAVAPVSVGAFAVGFLAIGAVGVGVIGLGTFGVGLLAIGGIAIGLKAYAGMSALGWFAARSNGFGVARVAADAPVALAEHANTPAALALVVDPNAEQNQMIFYIVVALATLVPITLYARAVRRRLGPTKTSPENRDG